MNRSSSAEPQKGASSPPGGSLQKAATTSLTAAWLIYRSLLSGPVSQIVPAPTREAVFQLFCDIRANVPKDKRFLQRHAKAFTPQTTLGWLALSGVLGYAVSAALLVTTLSLGLSVAGLSVGVMVVLATGAFLASALGFMAFVLFTSAFVLGAVAFTALSGYVVGSSSLAVMRHITQLVFGGNENVKPSLISSEEMHQPQPSMKSMATTDMIPVNTRDAEEKPTSPTTTRPSTYAAPGVVLLPIKTASPTMKRSPIAPTTSLLSPPVAAITTPTTTRPQKEEVTSQLEESPTSTNPTFSATKCNLSTPIAVAVDTALASGEENEEKNAISLEREKLVDVLEIEKGENTAIVRIAAAPKPMKSTNKPNNPKGVAIQTNTPSTTPSGGRTITMIKSNTNERVKTSSPAPLPGPPLSTTGLLKPISPITSSVTAATAAQDSETLSCPSSSSSSSSSLSPIVKSLSKYTTIDSNDSPGAFTSVMQGWKEIEKKAAMESPNGGAAKLPLPQRNSKKFRKGKSSQTNKYASTPSVREQTVSTLDPKTPEM
jgi:hypothetical protein